MIRFPPGLEPVEDLSPADWVREALKDWPRGRGFLVRDLVPPIFEAYARILHRAHRPEDRLRPNGDAGRESRSARADARYVGGPGALVDRLVGEQVPESVEVREDTPAAL